MAKGDADVARFLIVYRFMWAELGLSGVTLHVYARIYGFCQGGAGIFFESRNSTARFLGTTPRTVSRSVSELLACNLIFECGEHKNPSGITTRCYSINHDAVDSALASERAKTGMDLPWHATGIAVCDPLPPDEMSSPDKRSPPDEMSCQKTVNPDGSSGDPVTGCHPKRKGERK